MKKVNYTKLEQVVKEYNEKSKRWKATIGDTPALNTNYYAIKNKKQWYINYNYKSE